MGRTKHFARRSPSAPPENGGSVADNCASQDSVPQTEYYPVVLKWTVQGIQQQRRLNYHSDLEEANDIIAARLARHFVKAEDLEWAKRVGEQERARFDAEAATRKAELKRRWAPRPVRKIKAGKRLTAAELTFLDPNVEDSASGLTEVSNVSDLRPGSRNSPAEPEVRQVMLLEDMVPADSSSHSRQVDEASAEEPTSHHSQAQDAEESSEDTYDEDYWANEAAMWNVGSANSAVAQEDESEDDDGAEDASL